MRKLRWMMLAILCLSVAVVAPAQSVDAFFGFNTLLTKAGPNGAPKMGGGLYPNAGGDIMFLPHHLGVGMQVAWRGSQQNYLGVGARPVLYDFNLVWQPLAPGAALRPDFMVGFGGESLRFYQGTFTCGTFSGCTNYISSKHFLWHASVGLKTYLTEHIFLRPAVDYYNIRNNNEYGVPSAWQVGLSIGYTLGTSS